MTHRYLRRFGGPLQAVILDWAGTTADFGCMAPVEAFVELFKREGLALTPAQAREPMGTEKKEHIRRLLRLNAVREQWQALHKSESTEADIARLYEQFLPIQIAAISQHSALIPGAAEAVQRLRARGLRIGANTGYNRAMLAPLEASAKKVYAPDVSLAAEDAPRGRPWPDLALLTAVKLGASCVQACIKVDDTVPGIEEGLNAGMWTVAVAVSGNEIGLPLAQWNALPAEERSARREQACTRLQRAGAHYVIDTIADIDGCIADINLRLAGGKRP